ncbi:MAG: hypothetical protein ACRD2N_17305 [Vicinamibacterales bacterium]
MRRGPPLTLADTSVPTGAWLANGTIVFMQAVGGSWSLFRVPAAGGVAETLTTPDADKKEIRHIRSERRLLPSADTSYGRNWFAEFTKYRPSKSVRGLSAENLAPT